MSLFTSGERRGTIALAAIMAIVVITLAVTAGMHRNSPAPQPAASLCTRRQKPRPTAP